MYLQGPEIQFFIIIIITILRVRYRRSNLRTHNFEINLDLLVVRVSFARENCARRGQPTRQQHSLIVNHRHDTRTPSISVFQNGRFLLSFTYNNDTTILALVVRRKILGHRIIDSRVCLAKRTCTPMQRARCRLVYIVRRRLAIEQRAFSDRSDKGTARICAVTPQPATAAPFRMTIRASVSFLTHYLYAQRVVCQRFRNLTKSQRNTLVSIIFYLSFKL